MDDIFDEDERVVAGAATSVGFSAINGLMDYYSEMLAGSLAIIAVLTDQSQKDVRESLERELGLEGKLDLYESQLVASTDVIFDLMREE